MDWGIDLNRVKQVVRDYYLAAVLAGAAFIFGAVTGMAGMVVINPPEHTHVMWNGETIHGEMSKK